MPVFGNPFSVLKHDRLLTHEELVRAVRFMIAAEYEATQLYEQLAESTDHEIAQGVLRDIATEERVHAGEFLRLLKELQPDEDACYLKGAKEVEAEFLKSASSTSTASSDGSSSRGLGVGSLQKSATRTGVKL